MARSISFDKVAAIYDATRGGLERGVRFAAALAPRCGPGPIFEIGIGTGAIALPLGDALGRAVLGADLSPAMLLQAQERLGARVAVADVGVLPLSMGSVGTIVASWVLHLVGDPAATLRECRRVLRADGRLLVISSNADFEPDEIGAAFAGPDGTPIDFTELLRGRADVSERLIPMAEAAGFALVEESFTARDEWHESPADVVERMAKRQWGVLIDLDQARFDEHVQPVIDRLCELPEPDRARVRASRNHLSVFATR